MCHGWHCGGLTSLLLLLLLGQNLGLLIEIPQDVVSGTMGQSVLLPVSYRVNSSHLFPVSIVWKFCNSSQVIITCTVRNCSLDAWGAPKKCTVMCFPHVTHRGRVELFPENASLLLRDLQLSDSGVYSITFQQLNQSRQITLAVHKQRVSTEHPDEGTERGAGQRTAARIPCYSLGACYCFILLLLQLLFHLLCMRGGSQQQGRPGEA
ncbi:hypothetical protein CIB84_000902 [Bambusicola thoracicus]|uniref:Immunoglobulin V-set domain-containing protein n=1 Tax=Bambusicola thoracicus TaxID=9083 RepID=A0A2P4TG65_BAMTH|nr:hypothetical protein CIB84_000902 [Bambusicola thoracicus]